MIEKLTFKNLGKHQDQWATIYIEPNNTYSECGGRIIVILEDYVGTAFSVTVEQILFKSSLLKVVLAT